MSPRSALQARRNTRPRIAPIANYRFGVADFRSRTSTVILLDEQYVGDRVMDSGAVHEHWRREVGGSDHSGRSVLPALALTAERKFSRCVQSGEPPRLFGIDPPRPRIEAIRNVDMSGSNAWAEFANLYRLTRPTAIDHDRAKTELKALVPEDAREASGHGVRAKRSKSGAISFELLAVEASHAALQR
jgi:hypothetical protein